MDKSPQAAAAASAPAAESDCKYDTLYRHIVDYMERDEPFRNHNFNISHLATATDSNVRYVSNAIREKTGMNFSPFINSYRVEFAKKALQQADTKYTIEHLSQSVGFSNQTTFNRVFKTIEGLTPTEYMNLNQKHM
jgi:YesN/AraC family two-component response regulator